ncbi:MAG: FMN-binding protein [Sphaerochaeta sp.]|nr:FMN-binding protein [Sphaerochaeta sp.]
MKKRNKILLICIVILLVIYAAGNLVIKNIESDLKELSTLEITDVDFSQLKNGTYKGSYAVFPVDVEVEVEVSDAEIQTIQIVKHRNGQGKPAEIIPSLVVKNQSLDVDVISGATYSSKAILKAIELAVLQK